MPATFLGQNQCVARRPPLGHRRQTQPRRRGGRQVLEAVYGQIDAAIQQGELNLLGEDSPPADLLDRPRPRSPAVAIGTSSTSIPRPRNCAATHSACQRASGLARVPRRMGMIVASGEWLRWSSGSC